MSLPLTGVKVIELSNYVAAPSAARILSDMGAEVIKIEAHGGDVWRSVSKNSIYNGTDLENPMFDSLNIGKKSICLNAKDPKGMEVLMRMLETADVFITNTRVKSLIKLGLDSETLTKKFPHLVYCSMDGYGEKGPDADAPGFDSQAFWTRSGFLLDMAEANSNYPVCSPTGIGDCVTGLVLVSGIMMALFARQKTGRGDIVKTSLYSSAIWTMNSMVLRTQPKYKSPFPRTSVEEGALTRKYKCKDGKWFVIHVLDYNKDAHKVYDLLGISEKVKEIGIVDAATKRTYNAELSELCEQIFLTRDCAEWVSSFKAADLVADSMYHFSEVSTDEQAWANDFLEEFTFRSGETCAMPRTPIRMASVPIVPSPPAPLPGEQTDEILRAYGFGEDEILDMKNRGVVN